MPPIAPPATPLAEDHAAVVDWIASVLDDVTMVSAPEPAEGELGVVVVDVAGVDDRRPDRDLPVRIHVTYLVVPADDIAGAELLVRLLVAAREAAHVEVVAEPLDATWWHAAGVAPRPCLRLRTLLVVARPDVERAQRVTQPLVVRVTSIGPLLGTVVDPEGRPLSGAVVRLLATGERTETDRRGRFRLPTVGMDHPHALSVTASGTTYAGTVPAGTARDLLVNCTPERE